MSDGPSKNQRFVDRVDCADRGIELAWNLRNQKRLLRQPTPTSDIAHLLDVSAAGASVRAPSKPAVARESIVWVAMSGAKGLVRVKSVRPDPAAGSSIYGVEFVELDHGLREQLMVPLAERRAHVSEANWA